MDDLLVKGRIAESTKIRDLQLGMQKTSFAQGIPELSPAVSSCAAAHSALVVLPRRR